MKVSREKLLAEANATGFRPEMLEKAIQLVGLLGDFRAHPYLKDRWALKGGTALNLFVFDLPRLSVDIDLNYTGAAERQKMLDERPRVEQAVNAVFSRGGFTVNRQPADHAGGKWRLRYPGGVTEGGNLEVDLNFMLRVPLWPAVPRDSKPVGSFQAKNIPVLDVHELAAGKLAALLSRHASRDLFDAHQLLTTLKLDPAKLRLAFVLYGGMNRKDWRTARVEDVGFEERELQEQLTPVLSQPTIASITSHAKWVKRLLSECKDALSAVLPMAKNELEFLELLLEKGEIRPELLTNDLAMADRITSHPAIQWKALNVKQHKGT